MYKYFLPLILLAASTAMAEMKFHADVESMTDVPKYSVSVDEPGGHRLELRLHDNGSIVVHFSIPEGLHDGISVSSLRYRIDKVQAVTAGSLDTLRFDKYRNIFWWEALRFEKRDSIGKSNFVGLLSSGSELEVGYLPPDSNIIDVVFKLDNSNEAIASLLTKREEILVKKDVEAEIWRKYYEKRNAEDKRKEGEARRSEERRRAENVERKSRANNRVDEDLDLETTELQYWLIETPQDYIAAIRQKIQRNWQKRAGSGKLPICEVRIQQEPGGIIRDVAFGKCGGSPKGYRLSIEYAVYGAEPLPEPDDPDLFQPELTIMFNPEE